MPVTVVVVTPPPAVVRRTNLDSASGRDEEADEHGVRRRAISNHDAGFGIRVGVRHARDLRADREISGFRLIDVMENVGLRGEGAGARSAATNGVGRAIERGAAGGGSDRDDIRLRPPGRQWIHRRRRGVVVCGIANTVGSAPRGRCTSRR